MNCAITVSSFVLFKICLMEIILKIEESSLPPAQRDQLILGMIRFQDSDHERRNIVPGWLQYFSVFTTVCTENI